MVLGFIPHLLTLWGKGILVLEPCRALCSLFQEVSPKCQPRVYSASLCMRKTKIQGYSGLGNIRNFPVLLLSPANEPGIGLS